MNAYIFMSFKKKEKKSYTIWMQQQQQQQKTFDTSLPISFYATSLQDMLKLFVLFVYY